jgi:2-C-methyl-D-erythritol 4-phosphate cytidylyltransferase
MTPKVDITNISGGALSYDGVPLRKYAIILAGGSGQRAGGGLPKQFRNVGGLPMLLWSMKAFKEEDSNTEIILVVNPGFFDDWDIIENQLPESERIPYTLICGGKSRWHSVANGLMSLPKDEHSLVAVHDGARPLVNVEMIRRGWKTAAQYGTAVPVVKVTDSLRKLTTDTESESVDRSSYRAVQTPQVFNLKLLKEGYSYPESTTFTDDASVIESMGKKITLYEGDPINIKVTEAFDIQIADLLLKQVR